MRRQTAGGVRDAIVRKTRLSGALAAPDIEDGVGTSAELEPPARADDALKARVRRHLAEFGRRTVTDGALRPAAVAVVILSDTSENAAFLITRRADGLRNHGGQWALPGGRLDAGETANAAALRELHEEVGVSLGEGDVLGLLDDYPTRSGFVITPVVVWGGSSIVVQANPAEVAEVHRVALSELDKPDVPHLRSISESDRPVISIPMLGTHIHAPTAAILFQLREVAVWGRDTRVDHFEQPVFAWR